MVWFLYTFLLCSTLLDQSLTRNTSAHRTMLTKLIRKWMKQYASVTKMIRIVKNISVLSSGGLCLTSLLMLYLRFISNFFGNFIYFFFLYTSFFPPTSERQNQNNRLSCLVVNYNPRWKARNSTSSNWAPISQNCNCNWIRRRTLECYRFVSYFFHTFRRFQFLLFERGVGTFTKKKT